MNTRSSKVFPVNVWGLSILLGSLFYAFYLVMVFVAQDQNELFIALLNLFVFSAIFSWPTFLLCYFSLKYLVKRLKSVRLIKVLVYIVALTGITLTTFFFEPQFFRYIDFVIPMICYVAALTISFLTQKVSSPNGMKFLGTSNKRRVFYVSVPRTNNWAEELPGERWLVIPIADSKNNELAESITQECLGRNVSYVCALGSECEWMHDCFDETIVENKVKNEKPGDPDNDFDNAPMTTWHHDFSNGFWLALYSANVDGPDINKVVCLDLTEQDHQSELKELITKFNGGWLPPDA